MSELTPSTPEPVTNTLPPSEGKPEHHGGGGLVALAVGSLGVVFGDIGTSPLYTFQECVGPHGAPHTPESVLGVLSLIFWSLMLVVTLKYVAILMNADNQGEGGIMALLALVPREQRQVVGGRIGIVSLMVIGGAALLFGDGVITPAISVLSAMEGLSSVNPVFTKWVVPLTVGILFALFFIQKYGTGILGKLFGPVMIAWFGTIAVLGAVNLWEKPDVLWAILPTHAIDFLLHHGWHGFALLGSVVLAVTGGEALYADMGHFGKSPIRLSWLGVVLPSLILCYFGQGALLLRNESALESPFFHLVNGPNARLALVFLAAAATIIASQGLISAVFSLTHQAIRLGYFPRVRVLHTSRDMIGQIYLPIMNWSLMVACIALVLIFQKSSELAAAFGLAVSGTMTLTSIIFYHALRHSWGWSRAKSLALVTLFLSFDIPFVCGTAVKFFEGGYIPFTIGAVLFAVMVIWCRGRGLLREHFEANLADVEKLPLLVDEQKARTVPGLGVYLTSDYSRIPNSLDCQVRRLHSVFETIVLFSVNTASIPYVESKDRVAWYKTSDGRGFRVKVSYGFMEIPNVPGVFRSFADSAGLGKDCPVTYLVGRENFAATGAGKMSAWQETVFSFLSRNCEDVTMAFSLPPEQVIEIGNRIDL